MSNTNLNETTIQRLTTKRESPTLRRGTSPFRDSAYRAAYVVALVLAMTGWIWFLLQGAQWLYGL
jgi:hypothetical protein